MNTTLLEDFYQTLEQLSAIANKISSAIGNVSMQILKRK